MAAQQENTYTLKGFTVGSKCVVWSSLRNTWSKCEILEITEEGTRVSKVEVLYLKMYLQTTKEILLDEEMQLNMFSLLISLDELMQCKNCFIYLFKLNLLGRHRLINYTGFKCTIQ